LATSIGGALTHHWTGPLTRHMASQHHSHIPMYALAALWEWALLALVLWGARLSGVRLRQLLGVHPIVLLHTLRDQPYLPRIGHDHFMPHRRQVPAYPRRMRSHLQRDPAGCHLGK